MKETPDSSICDSLQVSLIALDVLHPCAYLWVGQSKQMSSEKALPAGRKDLPCQFLLILHVDDFKSPRYSRYPSSTVKEECNKFVDRSFHVELKV